jgi:hypothetical protein
MARSEVSQVTHQIYIMAYSAHYEQGSYRGPFKVGIAKQPLDRIKDIQTGNPQPIEVIWVSKFMDRGMAYAAERFIHELLKKHRISGEWFNPEPKDMWWLARLTENAIKRAGRIAA